MTTSRWLLATVRWCGPLTRWVCLAGLVEHMIVLPAQGVQESAPVLLAHYGIIAAALALREYSKTKGTATEQFMDQGVYQGPNA